MLVVITVANNDRMKYVRINDVWLQIITYAVLINETLWYLSIQCNCAVCLHQDRMTSVFIAAKNNCTNVLSYLLKVPGVDIDARDKVIIHNYCSGRRWLPEPPAPFWLVLKAN